VFKNKLYDYMEDNLQNDMKKAMEEHMEKCEVCKGIYEEEKRIDDSIKNTLAGDERKINSSRASIMKNIDKNKYTGSVPNKMGIHIKKYGIRYLSYVAILTLVVVSSSLVLRFVKDGDGSFSFAKKDSVALQKANTSSDIKIDKSGTSSSISNEKTTESKLQVAETTKTGSVNTTSSEDLKIGKYTLKFAKVTSEKDPVKDWAMAAKTSPDGKLKAQIDGRGPNGMEEGPADIFLEKGTTEKWRFQIVNELVGASAQITPMYLEWLDNENLLITAGNAYGTVTFGGSVYKMNINTGELSMFYKVDSSKEQVTIIEKSGNNIKLTLKVFLDDNMNKTKDEERIIPISQ
jgi:hypothetical protein